MRRVNDDDDDDFRTLADLEWGGGFSGMKHGIEGQFIDLIYLRMCCL